MKKFTVLAAAAAMLVAGSASAQSIAQNKTATFTQGDTTIVVTYDFLNYANGVGNKIAIVKRVQVTAGPSVGIVAEASDLRASGFQPLVGSERLNLEVVIDRVNGNNTGDYDDTRYYTRISGISLN
jgi:predicted RND superfamily exporter protein